MKFEVALLLWTWLTWTHICDCAPLQTNVTGRDGPTSCVGETVTFICSLSAISHVWISPTLGLNAGITRQSTSFDGTGMTMGITIVTTADDGSQITTALSLTSLREYNGTNITCVDGNAVTITEIQETIVMVFDPPSPPRLNVTRDTDLMSFDFIITPSSPLECVDNYVINSTSSADIMDITVPAGQVDGSTPVNEGGFNLCSTNYSFTVAPVTSEGTGPRSGSIDVQRLDTSGITDIEPDFMLVTSNQTLNVTIKLLQPSQFAGRSVVAWRTTLGGANDSVPFSGNQSLFELDCQYDGAMVTVYVQFADPNGCSSMVSQTTVIFDVVDDICEPTTMPPPPVTTVTTTTGGGGGTKDNTSIIVGVIIAVVVVIILILIVVIIIAVCKKKKGKGGSDTQDGGNECFACFRPTPRYHSSGPAGTAASPQASVEMEQHAPGAMYADPKAIEHESVAGTGEEYALISSDTKAKKKKNDQPEASANLGDMYSVPDKSKKKQNQNQGLVYADIDIANPQRPPPRSHGSRKQPQPEDESVTYAVVAAV